MKKVLLIILILALVLSMAACGQNSTEDPTASTAPTDGETQNTQATDPTEETILEDSVYNYVDFIVDVDSDRDPIVLQLTDPQIIDASQNPARLTAEQAEYWAKDKVNERCYDYIRETVQATNPDLILLTGDLVFGAFDHSGEVWLSFIDFMDSFQIPWAPIFGNHDAGSKMGIDWMCDQLESAEYCLFMQRELTGNSNYTVGIRQGDRLQRVFFMLDSNLYADMSDESNANGHCTAEMGFKPDQIRWYRKTAQQITALSPETKLTFAFHIQLATFADAYKQYGFVNYTSDKAPFKPVNIDTHPDQAEGDFGYIGTIFNTSFDSDGSIFAGIKKLGVDSILVGHQHSISASVVYKGIRFQFGQKSSTYDRANFLLPDGTITSEYDSVTGMPPEDGVPLVGGTVMPLDKQDGSIKEPYIYLCGGIDTTG